MDSDCDSVSRQHKAEAMPGGKDEDDEREKRILEANERQERIEDI